MVSCKNKFSAIYRIKLVGAYQLQCHTNTVPTSAVLMMLCWTDMSYLSSPCRTPSTNWWWVTTSLRSSSRFCMTGWKRLRQKSKPQCLLTLGRWRTKPMRRSWRAVRALLKVKTRPKYLLFHQIYCALSVHWFYLPIDCLLVRDWFSSFIVPDLTDFSVSSFGTWISCGCRKSIVSKLNWFWL